MLRKLLFVGVACAPVLAFAQPIQQAYTIPAVNPTSQTGVVNTVVLDFWDTSINPAGPNVVSTAHPLPVAVISGGAGGGGGSGGTVTQGAGNSSNPWYEQIVAGTAAIGSVSVTANGATVGAGNAFPTSDFPVEYAIGTPSDAAWTAGNATLISLEKAIRTALGTPLQTGGSVSVSNLPGTQTISAVALPLPAGAATSANQATPTSAGTSATAAEPVQGVTGGVALPTSTPALTYSVSTSYSAAVASAQLWAGGTFTRVATLCTLRSSTGTIWLNLTGGTAIVGNGLPVYPGGACTSLGNPAQPLPVGAVTGITDGASAQSVSVVGG